MKVLPADCADADLLEAVWEWVDLLAVADYAAAITFLHHPHPPDSPGAWTPELLETVVENYGSIDPRPDGRTFRVTSVRDATGDLVPRHEVDRWDGGSPIIGSIWFDLPLEGKWSDLTATFEIHRHGGGVVLVLDEVHVM